VEEGDEKEVLRMIKNMAANVNARNHELQTPLHLAISENQLEIMKLLIQEGADIKHNKSMSEKTPFHIAAIRENLQAVRILLESYE
jgi:ankyrin repeat protein